MIDGYDKSRIKILLACVMGGAVFVGATYFHLYATYQDRQISAAMLNELQSRGEATISNVIDMQVGDTVCLLPPYAHWSAIHSNLSPLEQQFIACRINDTIGRSDVYWWAVLLSGNKTSSPKLYKIVGLIKPNFRQAQCTQSLTARLVLSETPSNPRHYWYVDVATQ
ncbi:MAG: hypothetical protein Q4G13_02965 [Moraxella sp.]|nr:hypothetical protein [Moraxella sp.]